MARDIKEKLYEIDSKKIELGFLQQQFLVECKRFAAGSIEKIVRHAIFSNSAQALSMGKEGLTPVKAQVKTMIETISDRVEETVNTPEIWLHLQDDLIAENFKPDIYSFDKNQGPGLVENAIKKLFSPVGRLLVAHGLDSDNSWETVEICMVYRHPLPWGKEMRQCMAQYSERFNELARLVKEYETLSGQSSGNDAVDLWDSI